MGLIILNYFATSIKSVIHHLHPLFKLLFCLSLIAVVIFSKDVQVLLLILVFLYCLVFLARLPFKTIFIISLYPLFFVILFAVSNTRAGWVGFFVVILRVMCTTTTMLLLFSTTPYPCIFDYLSKVMPNFLSSLLLLTYQAIFILSSVFDNVSNGFYLRGGLQLKHPIRSITNLAKAFGYLISRGFETNEKVYESMLARGFKGKVYHYHYKFPHQNPSGLRRNF